MALRGLMSTWRAPEPWGKSRWIGCVLGPYGHVGGNWGSKRGNVIREMGGAEPNDSLTDTNQYKRETRGSVHEAACWT
jgi:hypothetical protein